MSAAHTDDEFKAELIPLSAPELEEALCRATDDAADQHQEIIQSFVNEFLNTASGHFHPENFSNLAMMKAAVTFRTDSLRDMLKTFGKAVAECEIAYLCVSSDIIDALQARYETEVKSC